MENNENVFKKIAVKGFFLCLVDLASGVCGFAVMSNLFVHGFWIGLSFFVAVCIYAVRNSIMLIRGIDYCMKLFDDEDDGE